MAAITLEIDMRLAGLFESVGEVIEATVGATLGRDKQSSPGKAIASTARSYQCRAGAAAPAVLLTFLAMVSTTLSAAAAPPTAVVVAHNELTEITDFLVPLAILSAGGFNVVTASTAKGPVRFWPSLVAETATTIDDITSKPDLIVVPFIDPYDDPSLIAWLKRHAATGTTIASICDGAFVLASAGLLDGRRATAHFYSLKQRKRDFPAVQWIEDARYVEDGAVFSTAGISASAPASVRLVEKFFGDAAARHAAAEYGIGDYSDAHDSDLFGIGWREATTYVWNQIRGLRKTRYQLTLRDGVDEYSLGFVVDLLSRTSRAAITIAAEGERVTTAHGLTLVPDRTNVAGQGVRIALPVRENGHWRTETGAEFTVDRPAVAVDAVLTHISNEYGTATTQLVATQLEFVP